MGSGNLLVLLTIGSTECAERTFFIRISIHLVLVNATPPRYTPTSSGGRGRSKPESSSRGFHKAAYNISFHSLCEKCVRVAQKWIPIASWPPPRAVLSCAFYPCQDLWNMTNSKSHQLLNRGGSIDYYVQSPLYNGNALWMNGNEKKKVSYPWKPTNGQRIGLISTN